MTRHMQEVTVTLYEIDTAAAGSKAQSISYSVTVTLAVVLALAGCDRPRPRVVPPDPMAAGPGQVEAPPAPTEGLSAGLARRAEMAGFTLDRIGAAADPLNRRPATTPAGAATRVDGFGFDPVAMAPGKGADVLVDGRAYGTRYGAARQDVAAYFKTPGLAAVGFSTLLPAEALTPGPHTVSIRVVAADGKGFFESPQIAFQAQ